MLSSSARSAATPPSPGRAAARAAASGTRWSRPSARAAAGAGRWLRAAPGLALPAGAAARGRGARGRPPARPGIAELDRVLGGGLVPGSLVLLGGSPGIGKSTLTGMALGNLAGRGRQGPLRVRARSRRRRCGCAPSGWAADALAVPALAETSLEAVVADARGGAAGRLRDRLDPDPPRRGDDRSARARSARCARPPARSWRSAKRLGTAVILVGHVTKDGSGRRAAGARAPGRLRAPVRGRARAQLPHPAGAQEPLRRDQRGRASSRCARAAWSRSPIPRRGSSARRADAPGSVRALLDGGHPAAAGRGPGARRADRDRAAAPGGERASTATGWRWCSRSSPATAAPSLAAADVFVNVAGGVRVDEPGADLAVALALASAHRGEPLADPRGTPLACFGEVGLTGELRYVAHPERRVAEAVKFGLGPVLGPAAGERVDGLDRARRRCARRCVRRAAGRSRRAPRPPEPSARAVARPGRRRSAT